MQFLLRVLVVFLLVLAAMSALRRLLAPSSSPSDRTRAPSRDATTSGGKLVRDPVCGTYVAASQALSTARGAETFHFCSEECRQKFLSA